MLVRFQMACYWDYYDVVSEVKISEFIVAKQKELVMHSKEWYTQKEMDTAAGASNG